MRAFRRVTIGMVLTGVATSAPASAVDRQELISHKPATASLGCVGSRIKLKLSRHPS